MNMRTGGKTMSEKGRKALKNNLLVGILYEIAGLACLMAALCTETKLDGFLFGMAGAGIGGGAAMLIKRFYWGAPGRIQRYSQMLDQEDIELRDELKRKLRDQSGRAAYLAGIGVICVTMVVLSAMSAWVKTLSVQAVILYLAAFLIFQFGIGLWFFRKMLKKYE